jgi:hypothetical protein
MNANGIKCDTLSFQSELKRRSDCNNNTLRLAYYIAFPFLLVRAEGRSNVAQAITFSICIHKRHCCISQKPAAVKQFSPRVSRAVHTIPHDTAVEHVAENTHRTLTKATRECLDESLLLLLMN